MSVLEELLLQLGLELGLGDVQILVLEDDGDLAVPGPVQGQHTDTGLLLVQGQEGLHLRNEMWSIFAGNGVTPSAYLTGGHLSGPLGHGGEGASHL